MISSTLQIVGNDNIDLYVPDASLLLRVSHRIPVQRDTLYREVRRW